MPEEMCKAGQVLFVGAGPGDPELITVKGLKALQQADVVIYAGSLVNPALLEIAVDPALLVVVAYSVARKDRAGLVLLVMMVVARNSVLGRRDRADPAAVI